MKKLSSVALIATAVLAAGAPAASAQTREYEGTVASVDRDSRTFRPRDSERGTVRVRVTSRTRFERISGLAGLRAGQPTSRPSCAARKAAGSRSRSSARAAAAITVARTMTTAATTAAVAVAVGATERSAHADVGAHAGVLVARQRAVERVCPGRPGRA